MKKQIFAQCQAIFPEWRNQHVDVFEFDKPKGFSSFTMGIRSDNNVNPPAAMYRRLEGKENAILDFDTEKHVFIALGNAGIAPHCYYYDDASRIEYFYHGRTLVASDLSDPEILRKIADQLYRLHQLPCTGIPSSPFFELVQHKWTPLARFVLEENIRSFPENEQELCLDLRQIYDPSTFEMVKNCMPKSAMTFCHNDTYHGNIMKLDTGEIRLLDFEFSCLNYKAYDFANLFAETAMRHGYNDYPYFEISEPMYGNREIEILVKSYLDNHNFDSHEQREIEVKRLVRETRDMLLLSDFKYAMAAVTLALKPIQKIPFITYAHQRFTKFITACSQRHI